jgi:hypothetical protein
MSSTSAGRGKTVSVCHMLAWWWCFSPPPPYLILISHTASPSPSLTHLLLRPCPIFVPLSLFQPKLLAIFRRQRQILNCTIFRCHRCRVSSSSLPLLLITPSPAFPFSLRMLPRQALTFFQPLLLPPCPSPFPSQSSVFVSAPVIMPLPLEFSELICSVVAYFHRHPCTHVKSARTYTRTRHLSAF